MKTSVFSLFFRFNRKIYTVYTYKILHLQEFLHFFGNLPNLAIVDYNGTIINGHQLKSQSLKAKDSIELLTIVGGG